MCAVTTTNARVLLYTCVAVDICSSWAVGVRAVTTTKAHVLLYTCQLLHISSAVCMCAVATHVLLCTHVNCYTCFTLYTYAVLRLICDVCAVATRVWLYKCWYVMCVLWLHMCDSTHINCYKCVTVDMCIVTWHMRDIQAVTQVDPKNPSPRGGFPIYYVPWSRTVCKRTPLGGFVPGSSRGVLLHTVFDQGT